VFEVWVEGWDGVGDLRWGEGGGRGKGEGRGHCNGVLG